MRPAPSISVLIVSRNRRSWLEQAVESARAQTFTDFEIILVDDGSTEDLSRLPVDVYIKTKAIGQSHARNVAMRIATGKYFFVLDSDDIIRPTCLEKEFALAEQGYDLVFCVLEYADAEGRSSGTFFESRVQDLADCLRRKLMPHPSSLFRAAALRGIWYDEAFESAADYDLLVRFLLTKPNIGMVSEPLYVYRQHHDQEGEARRTLQLWYAWIVRRRYSKYLVAHS